ncbi:MAG: radical SAM protein, partial [Elusimicrobia bacterium]|nr:radical SAM protein [Elusimicrobiota bacterium]
MSLRMELLIGYACGQECAFCMESDRMEEFAAAPLSIAEIVRALAVQRRRGVESVSFCGSGEPTFHPRLADALKAAKTLGYETELISNGSRLAEPEHARRLLPWVDRLWLSLHGDDAASHDRLTRRPGSFAKLRRAFAAARAGKGPRLGSVTVVTRENRDRVAAIARLALEEGAREVQLTQVVPMGRAEKDYARLAVPYSWWRENVPALAELARRHGARLSCAGVPLCALGEHWPLSREKDLALTVSVDRTRSGGRPALRTEELLPRAEAASTRVKPEACAACLRREECIGVPRPHLAAFGEGDLAAFGGGAARTETHAQSGGVERILSVNHACNQRCPFCFIPGDGWKAELGEIERELDRLAPELAGGGALTLSGGEPLAHPRL